MTTEPQGMIRPVRRALLSVHDKTGLVEFAQRLAAAGVELLSTGGTAAALRTAGLDVIDVSAVTGHPEIMDGRVKTLHPAIHGGLLARRDREDHLAALAEHGYGAIDLLVVNLYPFEATLAAGSDFATCVENIDIGGPAMIRAAAKNHDGVAVLVDPADYPLMTEALDKGGSDAALRRRLAARAFARTAAYDAAIAAWLARETASGDEPLPERMTLTATRRAELRYGENPHQRAALYLTGDKRPGVATATQLQGKALSFNNIQDAEAAFELVADLPVPSVAIIKHTNPCGAATGSSLEAAYAAALEADPVSAFGGIVACNAPVDAATATRIVKVFAEVVIAPAIEPEARAVFAAKTNLRVLETGGLPDRTGAVLDLRAVAGGLLVQDKDLGRLDEAALRVATRRAPTEQEKASLLFAWQVVRHVRSNAIVLAAGNRTAGIGAGQMSRVDSVEIAVRKAAGHAHEAPLVLASDAFFPFADGLEKAAAAGVKAVIQPGGSMRDAEVIEAADKAGIAMLMTGMRHFRH